MFDDSVDRLCDTYNLNEDQKVRRLFAYLLAVLRQKDNDYDFSGHIPTRFIIMMISSPFFFVVAAALLSSALDF